MFPKLDNYNFYRCEGCKVHFSTDTVLREHTRYQCEMRKDTHKQKHARRYTCSTCLHTFTKKGNLERHLLKCGMARNKERKSSNLCRKTSKSSRNVNGLSRKSRCIMCSYWFFRTELEKHLWLCRVKRTCLNRIHVVKIKLHEKILRANVSWFLVCTE